MVLRSPRPTPSPRNFAAGAWAALRGQQQSNQGSSLTGFTRHGLLRHLRQVQPGLASGDLCPRMIADEMRGKISEVVAFMLDWSPTFAARYEPFAHVPIVPPRSVKELL